MFLIGAARQPKRKGGYPILLSRAWVRAHPDKANLPAEDLPERVIQIGEGRFLRGFADWMIHRLNVENRFGGRIVVAAPRPSGRATVEQLKRQDGLYTIWLRGIYRGEFIDQAEIVSSVSRAIDPHSQWTDFLACAANPQIDILLSNTTESGIAYHPEPYSENSPASSFPAKVTAYLYHRFHCFDGDSGAGMTVIPCELIPQNGHELRRIVLQHSKDWHLPERFLDWVERSNTFCNTLVDRIVTGMPEAVQREEIAERMGYDDELLTVGEPFHLWAIDNSRRLRSLLPFHEIGLNVHFVDDVTPYRLQKMHILNGTHTAMSSPALMSGLHTVGDVMADPVFGRFAQEMMTSEIIPCLELDGAMLGQFAEDVLERYRNPYIQHQLCDLTLNASAKFRTRIIPIIAVHLRRDGPPSLLGYALAAFLYFHHPSASERWCPLRDDERIILKIHNAWRQEEVVGLHGVISEVLGQKDVWGEDLRDLAGLEEHVVHHIEGMRRDGVRNHLQGLTHVLRGDN